MGLQSRCLGLGCGCVVGALAGLHTPETSPRADGGDIRVEGHPILSGRRGEPPHFDDIKALLQSLLALSNVWARRRGPRRRPRHRSRSCQCFETVNLSGQDCDASRAVQGVVDCLTGCGLPTAPLPPGGRQRLVLPHRRVSATSSLDLSPRARDRHTDNSAVQRKLEELRRESYIVLWVTRSTMEVVTSPLGSLSLSSGHATCDM